MKQLQHFIDTSYDRSIDDEHKEIEGNNTKYLHKKKRR